MTMNSMMLRFNEIYKRLDTGNQAGISTIRQTISPEMADEMTFAENLYYNRTNNIPWLKSGEVKSLHIPSVLCREIANVVCSEADISIAGENDRAVYMNEIAKRVTRELPIYTEKALATGNLIFKPYVSNNRIYIKACEIGDFIPLRFNDSGELDSVAFVTTINRNSKWYVRVEYHHKENGVYTVENTAYTSSDRTSGLGGAVDLSTVPEWANIAPIATIEGEDVPMLFGFYRCPNANTVDRDSFLGLSVYSSCFDLFKECDELWEATTYEMKSGERKIFATPGAFAKIRDKYKMFRFYKELNLDGDMMREFSPAFRNANYSYRLQEIFKRIEENCGLAYGTISDPQTIERTATEVKHSKERMQATVNAIQTEMQYALEQMFRAIDIVCDLYGITTPGDYEPIFVWDDSVIESRQEKADRALMEYQNGLIDKADYFVQTRGMSRDEAETYISEMQTPPQVGADWFAGAQGT